MGTILTEDRGQGVLLATLNRPERLNAINLAWIADFHALLDRLDTDDTRVLVITGAGRGFCAGADLKDDLVSGAVSTEVSYGKQLSLARIVERLCGLRQPVIAAVNGPAVGGGFALTLAAEIRIAARSASFEIANARIGLSAGECGISWLFPRAVGLSRSFELMLTGRRFGAEEADRIGYVSRVVDDASLIDEAVALGHQIAAIPAFGVWMTKDVVRNNLEVGSLQAAIALESRTQLLTGSGDEFKRVVAAFTARSAAR